jgi:hypothetical protein
MIKYNYFGIDFQFEAKDFPQEGEALINAIHREARKKYNEIAQMIIDRNFDNYKKKSDIQNTLREFTTAQQRFPDTSAIAVVWTCRDMTPEEFRKKYRIVIATGYEDRETGEIWMTDFF